MRPFVAADFVSNEFLKFVRQLLTRRELCVQDHVGCGFREAVLIFARNDGGFAHRGMRDQNTFDFSGTQPQSVNFKNVVRAPGVPVVALFILEVFVSRAEPVANKSLFSFFVLVPIAGASGITLNQQIANLVRSNGVAVLVDDSGFVARNDFSAGAGLGIAGPVGN